MGASVDEGDKKDKEEENDKEREKDETEHANGVAGASPSKTLRRDSGSKSKLTLKHNIHEVEV